MDQIINQLVSNFDFALILIINVITYFVIKTFDDINGDDVPTVWQKRIIFIIVAICVSFIYYNISHIPINIIINSCIISPVAWSWLAKPIANKLGIDYKQKYI